MEHNNTSSPLSDDASLRDVQIEINSAEEQLQADVTNYLDQHVYYYLEGINDSSVLI